MTNDELNKFLSIAQRTRGWVFREYPPQRVTLNGGCELIVLPPVLWHGLKCNPLPAEPCELIPLRRYG